MTKEERTFHANDISNQYVHRISPDDTDVMEEIADLPIRDIITIYSNACYAFENGLFAGINTDALSAGESQAKRYADATGHVKNIIIERLKTADVLWTITDKITESPFIDDINDVWVFTEKELADELTDYYMQQFRTTFVVTEIPKDEVLKFFGLTSYMRGAENFRVNMGDYAQIKLKAEWIVKVPDFNGVPEINRPVMNPIFFRSVAKLQEERLYKADYDGKKEKLRVFEDDMIMAFHDARFLVPVKGMDLLKNNFEEADTQNGEGTLSEGTKISIPSLSKGEGDNISLATPVFTDWEEFNKVYSQKEWGGWIWKAQDLISAPDDAVVVNAGSLGFEISKKMIQQMLDIYENEFAVKDKTINKDELPADFQPYAKEKPVNTGKSGGKDAVNAAIRALDKASGALPNTLAEFMDAPCNVTKEEFLKKYGAEKVFRLIGYNKEKDKWSLSHSPKYEGVWSEGAYFTYEDALSALMMRNVSCPVNKWVLKQSTVTQMLGNLWTIRFIRNDGKTLTVKQDDNEISVTAYTQRELLEQFISEYGGRTVVSEDLYKDMTGIYLDDIVLWVLARPNATKDVAKWSLRMTYKYKREGSYNNESCYHIFATYEEALKESKSGYYPQKTTLYQELTCYTDLPHLLYSGDKEVLFVPKKMAEAKAVMTDVRANIENTRIDNDIVSYLKESGMSEKMIDGSVSKLKEHEDVLKAFHSYIMSMEYPEGPIIEGYSPKSLHEEAGDKLSPLGVMNYMIYLRQEPERALKDLKAGLPRK